MANDLLQERIQHSGILWLSCPANYWDVMFHRKLVSEEVTVLDPWIYHRAAGAKKKKKDQETLSPLSPAQGICWFLQNTSKSDEEKLWALGVDSQESCAAGMAALPSWRVIRKCGTEGENGGDRKYIVL